MDHHPSVRDAGDSGRSMHALITTRLPRTARTLALLSVTACFLEPGDQVDGQWGGRHIAMNANQAEVLLEFPCMKAATPRLALDSAHHFEELAPITAAYPGGPQSLRLSGSVRGHVMELSVTTIWERYGEYGPDSYTLRQGAAPDFSGVACLK